MDASPKSKLEAKAVKLAFYNELPSYQEMFAREGASGPAEVALVGNEDELRAQLGRIEDAGATDFLAQPVAAGPGSVARTMDFLATLL